MHGVGNNLIVISFTIIDAIGVAMKVISEWIILRLDSFVAYAYSSRIYPLEFFLLFFSSKTIKKIPMGKCESYTHTLQTSPPKFIHWFNGIYK